MLDLYKLHIFAQVAQCGSFSAAARQLYMTQPAVSQHMQELEAALGVRLFERGSRGVTLTAEGTVLKDYTQRILKMVGEAEHAVLDVANLERGQISIGATPGVSTYLLPTWVLRFQDRYPKLTVATHTGTTTEIAAQLVARQMDLGFIEGELDQAKSQHIESEVLCDVPQLVVVGPKHPLWTQKTITMQDLDGQALITRQPGSQTRIWLDGIFALHGVRPRVVAEFDNPEAIKRSIAAGAALAVLPAYAVSSEIAGDQLRALRLDPPLSRALRAVWNKSISLSPLARAFRAFAEACVHGGALREASRE